MATYSFLDVQASITGPGGVFSIGSQAGAAEEGLTISMREEKSTLVIGADGSPMHSLHADKSATITVRLLKTSPANGRLSQMYALQTSSGALHGQNVIVVSDIARGDVITCRDVAFAKLPDISYAKDGAAQEWAFMAGRVDMILGTGGASSL